jgi:hypothetical protein
MVPSIMCKPNTGVRRNIFESGVRDHFRSVVYQRRGNSDRLPLRTSIYRYVVARSPRFVAGNPPVRRPRMKFSISFQHAFNIIMARFICSGTPMVVSRDPYLGPEQCDSCIALALHRHSRFFLLLMREIVRRLVS